jgi:hypothetical protein
VIFSTGMKAGFAAADSGASFGVDAALAPQGKANPPAVSVPAAIKRRRASHTSGGVISEGAGFG